MTTALIHDKKPSRQRRRKDKGRSERGGVTFRFYDLTIAALKKGLVRKLVQNKDVGNPDEHFFSNRMSNASAFERELTERFLSRGWRRKGEVTVVWWTTSEVERKTAPKNTG